MIKFTSKGDYSKVTRYFQKLSNSAHLKVLDKYGQMGVEALSSATPTRTGTTASSWSYEVTRDNSKATISFSNSNINKGVPIAIILQYGHGTGTGGWVEGRDYINPSIQPIFDKIVNDAWKEVTNL